MLNTFVIYVENDPSVLIRLALLFRRRGFSIDSLTAGKTEQSDVSRVTISVEAHEDQAPQIEASLHKLFNVISVENITTEALVRDLVVIKVAASHDGRSHLLELARIFRARVIDATPEALTLEATGAGDKIDGLVEILRPFGILEMAKTRIAPMRRGVRKSQTRKSSQTSGAKVSGDISHSV